VIPEVYEDSDSDEIDGVILTKQERRRLNQLNLRRNNFSRSSQVGATSKEPALLGADGALGSRRKQLATPASEDSQFDIL